MSIFDFGTPAFERLDKTLRFAIFREVAKSELIGLIFTLVWDFGFTEDEAYVDEIIEIFRADGAEIHIVELQASLEERLKRNIHEHRLAQKPSKRNLEMSEKSLRYAESEYRMISKEGEFPDKPIFKIDNSHLSPEKVAAMIKEKFNL
ncbi:MAG: shikimate kinase [Bacteroidota bacterium]